MDSFRYGWIHLPTAIAKEDSVNRQSSMDLFRRSCLHPARVKENSVSRQFSIDVFRYGWIHLQAEEDSVSRQSSIDVFRLTYPLHSKRGQCQPSI